MQYGVPRSRLPWQVSRRFTAFSWVSRPFTTDIVISFLLTVKHIPSWVPLSPRWQASKWRETADKVQTLPYSEAKRRVVSFHNNLYFVSFYLQVTVLGERGGAEILLDSDFHSSESPRDGTGVINASSDFIYRWVVRDVVSPTLTVP